MSSDEAPLPASDAAPLALRDRATILTYSALIAVAIAAWVYVVAGTRDSPDMTMDAMAPAALTLRGGVAFVASWGVMMAAMMLPSALPMIALYGAIQRKATHADAKGAPVAVFTLAYLVVWAATGVPVYLGSVFFDDLAVDVVPYGVALVLIAAGLFQLSALKHVCLRTCRSPLGFLLGHWRAGYRGSLALGLAHAAYCVGCCWALMVVLVAAGAMGLAWVLAIAAIVAAEKVAPGGEWIARVTGGALMLLGVLVALRPDLVTMLRGAHGM